MEDTNKTNSKTSKYAAEEEKVYMSEREMVEDKVYNGRLMAWITIPFGVLAEIVRVTVARLIFNKNERANIKEIFNRNLRSGPEAERNKQNESPKKSEKGENSNEKEIEKSKKNDMHEKAVYLDDRDIKSAFAKIGLQAELKQGSDEIILTKAVSHEGKILNMVICTITKDEILSGNANELMKSLYDHNQGNQYECAVKALCVLAAQNMAAKEFSGDDIISEVSLQTKNGIDTIRLQNSENILNATELYCNGVYSGIITKDTLCNASFETYRDDILEAVDTKMYRIIDIGKDNTLTLTTSPDGMHVSYTKDGQLKDLGSYTFEKESDVRDLIHRMENENTEIIISDENGKEVKMDIAAAAYVIGVIANPDMQAEKADDQYKNTFTGELESQGKAHLELCRSEKGVEVTLFMPGKDVEQKHLQLFEFKSASLLSEQMISSMINVTRDSISIAKENPYIDQEYRRLQKSDLQPEQTDIFKEPVINSEEEHGSTQKDQNKYPEVNQSKEEMPESLETGSVIDDFILELEDENDYAHPVSDEEKAIIDAAMEYTMGSAYADDYTCDDLENDAKYEYPDYYDDVDR